MKRFFSIVGVILFSALLFPWPVLAGSCMCDTYTITYPRGGGSRIETSKCYDGQKAINTATDCDGQLSGSTPMVSETFSGCSFCSGNLCGSGCPTDGLFSQNVDCTNDSECLEKAANQGVAKCIKQKCWFDQKALDIYQRGTVSALGWERQIKITKPVLSIAIPGVEFSDPINEIDAAGNIRIPFLAQYLTGAYKFAVSAGSIVAVIVIILNGFRVTISAGGPDKNKAIQNIVKAITGLFILWSSYAIFYTINPNLTQLNVLKIRYIDPKPLEEEPAITIDGTTAASETSIVAVSGDNMNWDNGVMIDQNVLKMVQAAATNLQGQGIRLYVASGYRSVDTQKRLITENCNNPPGSATCEPLPTKVPTCPLYNLDPKNCPHTTGRAVDVWGMKNGKVCVDQKNCSSDPNKDACRKDPCQAAVISAMKGVSFCSLNIEAWHFEFPKMSPGCN